MNKDEVKVAQKLLLEALNDFHFFCRAHGLKYYIIGGTLLGAMRHCGFIPWDVDADVAMPREDYEKLLNVIDESYQVKYFVQNIDTEKYFHTPKTKILVRGVKKFSTNTYKVKSITGLNLDIFPLDIVPNSTLKRKLQRVTLRALRKISGIKSVVSFNSSVKPKNFKTYFQMLVKTLLI